MKIKDLKFQISILILLSVCVYCYKQFIEQINYTIVNAIAPASINGISYDNLGVVSYLLSNNEATNKKIANALNVEKNKNIKISTQLVSGILILKVSGPDTKNLATVSKSIISGILKLDLENGVVDTNKNNIIMPRRLLYSMNSIIYENKRNALVYGLSIFLLGLLALLYFKEPREK